MKLKTFNRDSLKNAIFRFTGSFDNYLTYTKQISYRSKNQVYKL